MKKFLAIAWAAVVTALSTPSFAQMPAPAAAPGMARAEAAHQAHRDVRQQRRMERREIHRERRELRREHRAERRALRHERRAKHRAMRAEHRPGMGVGMPAPRP